MEFFEKTHLILKHLSYTNSRCLFQSQSDDPVFFPNKNLPESVDLASFTEGETTFSALADDAHKISTGGWGLEGNGDLTGDRHDFLLVDLTGSLKNLDLHEKFCCGDFCWDEKSRLQKFSKNEVAEMICLFVAYIFTSQIQKIIESFWFPNAKKLGSSTFQLIRCVFWLAFPRTDKVEDNMCFFGIFFFLEVFHL